MPQEGVATVDRVAEDVGIVVQGHQFVPCAAVDGRDAGEQDGQVGLSHRAGGCL